MIHPLTGTKARWLLAVVVLIVVSAQVFSQPLAVSRRRSEEPEKLGPPKVESNKNANSANNVPRTSDTPILPTSFPGDPPPAIGVTLPEVLKLAVIANLDIAQANLFVDRAQAALLRARSQLLPELVTGVQHQAHDGTIQRTEGTIIKANRDSLFVGGGPAISLDVSAAYFGLGQARDLLDAARHGQGRITLETLGRVADAYFTLLRARRQLARLDDVLDALASEQETELRGNSKGLLPLIKAFVKAGSAVPSDQDRVEADVVRRHGERTRALEDVRVASTELSRLLHLNAAYFLLPAEDIRHPLIVPGEAWGHCPLEELVAQALRTRPDLAENQALIDAAVQRYQQAKWQPLLPTVQASLSWGGFGGGPETKTNRAGRTFLGHSGNIKDFDVRTDLNLAAVWRLEGLGAGNLARIRDARLQKESAELRQLAIQDQVVAQVVAAVEGMHRAQQRYQIYRAGLFDDAGKPTGAVYRSVRLNFLRIKGGQGLPLEVLDSTRRLSDVLQGYADALTDFDRNRFRLLLALALPPEALIDPACMPGPPGAVVPVSQPLAAPVQFVVPQALQVAPEKSKNTANAANNQPKIGEWISTPR